jgi:rhodanese-related sulfurtransferase
MKRIMFLCFVTLIGVDLVAQDIKNDAQVSLENFEQKLTQASNPQILDVRSPEEFAENHLKGAVNFNVPDDAAFAKAVVGLNKKNPVFVYSINNGRSVVVSKKLREAGFTEVYALPGGLAHWIGAGKPVVQSEETHGLSQSEYQKLVTSDNVILVDVGSRHCGGCKKLEPVVTAISDEQRVKLVRIDLYANRELVKSLEIEAVPTLILYKGGRPIWKKSGTIAATDIQDALDQSL